jgi:hypothetical protein
MSMGTKYDFTSHAEAWLLLPWLANGRLQEDMRTRIERHVNICDACSVELAAQLRMRAALAAPERITHSSGSSLAKVLRRIDATPRDLGRETPAAAYSHSRRPVRLAWAASFLMAGVLASTLAYREMAPDYQVHSDQQAPQEKTILHVAFVRDLKAADAEHLLSAVHAEVVEGPGSTGIFGVRPSGMDASGDARQRLQQLRTQLRADPRVRWIEPAPAGPDVPASPGDTAASP